VVGRPDIAPGHLRAIELVDGAARELPIAAVLEAPARYFDV
jgi:hypothetical protein